MIKGLEGQREGGGGKLLAPLSGLTVTIGQRKVAVLLIVCEGISSKTIS